LCLLFRKFVESLRVSELIDASLLLYSSELHQFQHLRVEFYHSVLWDTIHFGICKREGSRTMKPDQERIKTLLADTVTLLCRNGLHFQHQLRVQGVLGITVDDSDVFIVHINESFTEQVHGAKLADFPGPLGAGFTASLVASLSGNIGQFSALSAGDVAGNLSATSANSGTVIQPLSLTDRQHGKHKADAGQCTIKRQKQEVQSSGDDSQDIKAAVVVQPAAIDSQWQFNAPDKPTQPASEATACYLGYAAGGSDTAATTVAAVPAVKRKANVYPPQSMLAMSFGGIASTVDYGSGVLHASGPSSANESGGKLWIDSGQNLVAAQQAAVKSEDQRLSTAVFDPMSGCTTWTVQHLIDAQNLQSQSEDQQQNLEVVNVLTVHVLTFSVEELYV